MFSPRVTVARDGTMAPPPPTVLLETAPRSANDARNAFDKLFKK